MRESTGIHRATPSSFRKRPWPNSSAASSGLRSRNAVPTWFCPRPRGQGHGSSIARFGERTSRPYLNTSRYVFRVAITNTRIVGLDDQTVTIRYKLRKSNRWRTSRISGHEFMRRFLQHVLPKGQHKGRYFGLWHPSKRQQAARVRLHLLLERPMIARATDLSADVADQPDGHADRDTRRVCPRCNEGHLVHIRRLSPKQTRGP